MKPNNLVIVRAVTGQGRTHAGAAIRFGVSRPRVKIIGELTIDPTRDYQSKKP